MAVKPYDVHIKLAPKGKLHTFTIDTLQVWIKRANEKVVWWADGCDVQVTFKKGSPFASANFAIGSGSSTGSGTNQIPVDAKYPYSLKITPNPPIALGAHGNMGSFTIDPEVVVDDNGPPNGGRRTKKARGRKPAKKKSGKKRAVRTRR